MQGARDGDGEPKPPRDRVQIPFETTKEMRDKLDRTKYRLRLLDVRYGVRRNVAMSASAIIAAALLRWDEMTDPQLKEEFERLMSAYARTDGRGAAPRPETPQVDKIDPRSGDPGPAGAPRRRKAR